MKLSAGTRGTSFNNGRQLTLAVTSLANNDYSRTADMVMNVTYTRMNETMRMGGKITGVAVSGGDLDAASASAPPARRKTVSKAAKAPG